jgi:hypothetical protein
VGESAEDLLPADPALSKVDRFGWPGAGLSRGELAEGAVRPPRKPFADGAADAARLLVCSGSPSSLPARLAARR